ncbi:MAG: DNA glycosylase, partial [Pygmaiobacter sp.]
VLTIYDSGGFDAEASFFCGQCFRWEKLGEGFFGGVVNGQKLLLTQHGDTVSLAPVAAGDITAALHYLALDDDYAALHAQLCRNPVLRRCVASAPGIRVLHQDFFEMLLTFIISQNNNIPRIRGIVDRLCTLCGEALADNCHAFPTPQSLAAKTEEDLAVLRAGWRSGYLLDAAHKVADGSVSETALRALSLADARALLMTIRGVGPKVADCVLLFGLGRMDAFPTDVWMKRAMAALFPKGLPRYLAPIAGIAQQYIFDYARHNPKLVS